MRARGSLRIARNELRSATPDIATIYNQIVDLWEDARKFREDDPQSTDLTAFDALTAVRRVAANIDGALREIGEVAEDAATVERREDA